MSRRNNSVEKDKPHPKRRLAHPSYPTLLARTLLSSVRMENATTAEDTDQTSPQHEVDEVCITPARGLNCVNSEQGLPMYIVTQATHLLVAETFVLPTSASMRKRDSCPYLYSAPESLSLLAPHAYWKISVCFAVALLCYGFSFFVGIAPLDCSSFFAIPPPYPHPLTTRATHLHHQDLMEPFHYINQVPGKDVRGKLIDAFQVETD